MSEPFTIDVAQAEIDDLHRRLDTVRWPTTLPGAEWGSGAPVDRVRELVRHWRHEFQWRTVEQRLNAWPHARTRIDGTSIHHVHVRSPRPDARPLLLLHGWPGSFVEYLDILGPLTDPEAHGGTTADPAFHVVLPSLPGYTLSGPVPDAGWNSRRVAAAMVALMAELGYEDYLVHGGDWGECIGRDVARIGEGAVRGLHITTYFLSAPFGGTAGLDELTPDEQAVLKDYQGRDFSIGYFHLLSERPETVGYGWSDSPVSLLAWMAEKFGAWTDWKSAPDEAVDRDVFLTNVSLYWFTNTANSAARLYHEQARLAPEPFFNAVPTGCGVYPREMSVPIRRLVEKTNNVVFWSEHQRGGHFAALEQPDTVVSDLRAFESALT